ncbi:hypothetical protein B1R94_08630 [Mycolicibacterium litorale]|nr:hypothetical protein B1R94_08630 [Mycolicibacterium litorale]
MLTHRVRPCIGWYLNKELMSDLYVVTLVYGPHKVAFAATPPLACCHGCFGRCFRLTATSLGWQTVSAYRVSLRLVREVYFIEVIIDWRKRV